MATDNPVAKNTPVTRFFKLLKPEKQAIIRIYLLALVAGLINLSQPLGLQAIINLVTAGRASTSWYILVIIVIVGIALNGLIQIAQLSLTERIQQRLFMRSSLEFGYRLHRLHPQYLLTKPVPELANRFFDTMTIQKSMSKFLFDITTASVQVVLGLILLSLYHPSFIAVGAVIVLLGWAMLRFTGPQGLKTSLKESKHKYAMAFWLQEIARSAGSFKFGGLQNPAIRRTDDLSVDYLEARQSHFSVLKQQYYLFLFFRVLAVAALLLLGGILVFNQQMNIGQFVAAEIIIILLLGAIEKLVQGLDVIYDMLTGVEKVGEVADLELEPDESEGLEFEESDQGIHVEASIFRNRDDGSVTRIDLVAEPGDRVAVFGKENSGKSALLTILATLRVPSRSKIRLNGYPMGRYQLAELRHVTGHNLTAEGVFSGTLRENLRMGKENISEADLNKAMELAGLWPAHQFFEQGLNQRFTAQTTQLSLGVASRILLARAIAGAPRLILLELDDLGIDRNDLKIILKRIFEGCPKSTLIAATRDEELRDLFDKKIELPHRAFKSLAS